jgi:hypothetical protein
MFYMPIFELALFMTMLSAHDVFVDGPTILPSDAPKEMSMICWGLVVAFQVSKVIYKYLD